MSVYTAQSGIFVIEAQMTRQLVLKQGTPREYPRWIAIGHLLSLDILWGLCHRAHTATSSLPCFILPRAHPPWLYHHPAAAIAQIVIWMKIEYTCEHSDWRRSLFSDCNTCCCFLPPAVCFRLILPATFPVLVSLWTLTCGLFGEH